MDAINSEVAIDASPLLRIYKDGRVERLKGTDTVPPGLDPQTNVESKDVLISKEPTPSVRLYVPKNPNSVQKKLPLLVYFHGGGFCIESAFSPTYHLYLNTLAAEANIVVVSVDYRLAPEHPIHVVYDDSWAALKWVASHFSGDGPEDCINTFADLSKLFLSGDSAGGNISYHMAMRYGEEKLEGLHLSGIVLVHPYFWGKTPVGDEPVDVDARAYIDNIWKLASPTTSGSDDPWINPIDAHNLAKLGCTRVLISVAEKDLLKHRGWYLYEKLKSGGWEGEVEILESPGEEHVFHLSKPTCENAVHMLKKIAAFMN